MTHTIREMRIIENRRHDIILDNYFVGLCIRLRKIGIIGRHDIKLSCVMTHITIKNNGRINGELIYINENFIRLCWVIDYYSKRAYFR